jgi:peptide/nickel transport system substrate-binding protein
VFDSLYEKALSESNTETRYAYYQQMDSLIIESAVIVPLYYDRVLRFTNKNITGFESNAMNLLDLKRVRKNIKH